MTLPDLKARLEKGESVQEIATPTIRTLQSLLPLPSGCENCWGDLHQGCTDACRRSSREWREKRSKIESEITALISALMENEE